MKRTEGAIGALSMGLGGRRALLKSLTRFARQQPLGTIGALILLVAVISALISPLIQPHDPFETHMFDRYLAPGGTIDGERFLLGTDNLGRDVLSRMLSGARVSLKVAAIAVGIGVTSGALLGVISAYIGGTVDLLFQRVVDAFMAFPNLILALGIMAVLGPSLNNVIFTLIVLFIPGTSRIVRAEALSVKERVYVDAARAIGSSHLRIIVRHVIPNCMAPYIVFVTANLGFAIVVGSLPELLGGRPSSGRTVLGRYAVRSRPEVRRSVSLAAGLPKPCHQPRGVRVQPFR